jgi:peptidyl-prolyl cis-trans isomerase A (cyclophilin A)
MHFRTVPALAAIASFAAAPLAVFALGLAGGLAAGCENRAPEIVSRDPGTGATTTAAKPPPPPAPAPTPAPMPTPAGATGPAATGPIELKTAIEGVTGTGALLADIETDAGKITCHLLDDKAPIAVANFVGLARGLQSFKDPVSGQWVKRPAYDGTTFHRIVKGFMIQGGDPTGTGRGDPGYVFNDEIWSGAKHDKAGLLCMANKGKNTNGMQFFITDDAAPHLDGNYTIFGECTPVATVHKIGATPVGPDGEKPILKPKILSVKVRREKA